MHSFTDDKGRRWTFPVNVWTVRRVKQELDLDLMSILDPESGTFQKITTDVPLLCDVMLVMLESALKEADVDDESFLKSLEREETVLNAAKACLDAVIHFFRGPKGELLRTAFGKVWNATENQQEEQIAQALRLVNSPEFDETVAREARIATGGKSSSDSPPAPA